MSPDNYSYKKRLSDEERRFSAFASAFPNVVALLDAPEGDFRGLTIMVSNRGGYLGIAKRYGPDGGPEILFSSGETPLATLDALNARLHDPRWKHDQR